MNPTLRRDVNHTTLRRLEARAELGGTRVLEIGCGPGRLTQMYADLPRFVVAVDPCSDSLKTAVRRVPAARFAHASGMDLPFGDAGFDVVLFSLSLHHHPEPSAALAEARRVLAPGGRLPVLEPMAEGEIQRLCNVFDNEDDRLAEADRALGQAGLRVLTRDVFSTDWVFDDFEAVAKYAFGHYGFVRDEVRCEAMRGFLGPKADKKPILMTDTLRLTCLAEQL